jgi:hypothetical protein
VELLSGLDGVALSVYFLIIDVCALGVVHHYNIFQWIIEITLHS